ncbi:MAG: hypothetical protein IJX84_01810 [Clostridia bacterium]|nr:hypothetical protein [Clostridia bacterium]
MHFGQKDNTIVLERELYCFVDDHGELNHYGNAGKEAMVLSWCYTCPDGWGLINAEYILVADIRKLKRELYRFNYGALDCVHAELYQRYKEPFIRLDIKRGKTGIHFSLDVYNANFDEYQSVSCICTQDEWEVFMKEFASWGEKYPVHLGDRVEVIACKGHKTQSMGKIGVISEIYPPGSEELLQVSVCTQEEGWSGPYQHCELYDMDEIKLLD